MMANTDFRGHVNKNLVRDEVSLTLINRQPNVCVYIYIKILAIDCIMDYYFEDFLCTDSILGTMVIFIAKTVR